MPDWRVAADGITPGAKQRHHGCRLQQLLDNDDPKGELASIVAYATKNIDSGNGRYTYIRDVVKAATDGAVILDAKSVSDHINGEHRSCRRTS